MQLLHNDTVGSIATKYSGKTAAHILLRWAVQQGIGTQLSNDVHDMHTMVIIATLKLIGVIPKASSVKRVQENSEIFDFQIDEEDMELLNESLDSSHHFCWDPTDVA